MNYTIDFTVPGVPIPQQRARYYDRGGLIRVYDPQAKEKRALSQEIRQCYAHACLEKSLFIDMNAPNFELDRFFSLELWFYMSCPDRLKNSQKNEKLSHLEHAIKPDIDNLIKFFLDAANGILWPDDSMISKIVSSKFYSKNPRTEVRLMSQQKSDDEKLAEKILNVFDDPVEMQTFFFESKDFFSAMQQLAPAIRKETIGRISPYFMQYFKKHCDKIQKIIQIVKKQDRSNEKE